MGGGGKKSKAPKAPDYAKLAQTEAVENRKTAEELTRWNRPTQTDAFGNKITWTQDGAGNWSQKQELSPLFKEGQTRALAGFHDASQQANLAARKGFQAPESVEFDPTAGDKLAADTYESVMGRARPEQQREQSALDVKLRQQGLQPGTEAYNRAMQNMLTAHGDVATQAGLTSTKAGYDEARARFAQQMASQNQNYAQALKNYQMPFDVAGSMANLYAAAPRPEFPGFSGATGYNPADLTGAAQAKYQSQMGEYNAGQNKKGSSMGMIGTLGSSAISAFSDANLKEDMRPLSGEEALRKVLELGGYSFKWRSDGTPDLGLMAQEVQQVLPELVESRFGYLAVNYTGIVALLVAAVAYLAGAADNAKHV